MRRDRELQTQGLEAPVRRRRPQQVAADLVEKIRLVLSALEAAGAIGHLNQPSFRLHPLKGDLKGHWAVTVRANWRIVFGFEGDKATDVDLIDYH
ncbi:proteic killer suppression protein [Roseiarcus fermentans]|uniref:Proteic killer suppression protein n=2 Tax=Roseiarcus fermentans TaxID=1473586 RepID=A0A366F7B0_9HYPH|nr:proteic killer suppression protein [Roseiarcus fermentans]